MKRLVILGSTGSIGQSTLDVVRRFPDGFSITGLSAYSNIDLLSRQIREFRPDFVCVGDSLSAQKLRRALRRKTSIFIGAEGLKALVRQGKVDEVVVAISGSGALLPLLEAIRAGKEIVLANKEALVAAGAIIMRLAAAKRVKIKPVDSEQSAIWQCLEHQEHAALKNIYLTASGGPFYKTAARALPRINVNCALRHPRWKMGKKISIDSATLMNKGLEVLEAMHLFKVAPEKIKVLIHPEAVVHSMVGFIDGVVMAQLSTADMRIPIQYALGYPRRLPGNRGLEVDFFKLGGLHFYKPDSKKFPCLELAYRAARQGGTAPCALNAANEAAVEAFLEERLGFMAVPEVIQRVLGKHRAISEPSLEDIFGTDAWARQEARKVIKRIN